MGGRLLASLNAKTRAATGRGAGDEIEVRLEVGEGAPALGIPDALQAALKSDSGADAAGKLLSYSKQKAHALAVSSAKTEKTRQGRLSKVLESLRA